MWRRGAKVNGLLVDLMILRVFSNLKDFLVMILWREQGALWEEMGYMDYVDKCI